MVGVETEARHNLLILKKKGLLDGRKIILFGISDYTDRLIRILEEYSYKIYAVIDNNIQHHNHIMGGTRIRTFYTGRFFEKYDDSYIFLLISGYYDAMKKQLESHGYVDQVHIFRVAEVDKSDLWHTLNRTRMELFLSDIKEGRKLHKQLLEEYGENIRIILWCGQSLGDIYLMGFYIKKYLKTHKNCLFVFGRKASAQLAEELGFGQVLYMQKNKVWELIHYAKTCGFDKVNIEHLHTSAGVHFRIQGKMLRYLNYTLMDDYRELFELPDNTVPNVQRLRCQGDVDEYFKKYGLIKEKTVILAPNAQAFPLLENEFWEKLAGKLCERGYTVCTNAASKDEYVVSGTIPVFVRLNDIQEFAEKAGYFIALRSGLCDILCNCDCKKIILYNFVLGIDMNEISFFSLKNMGFGKNTSEYGINQENETKILEQILAEMK